LNQLSLSHESIEKAKKRETKQKKNDELIKSGHCPKIREIRTKGERDYTGKVLCKR